MLQGLRVKGRVWVLGFRVRGLGFRVKVEGLGFGVGGFGVWGFGHSLNTPQLTTNFR